LLRGAITTTYSSRLCLFGVLPGTCPTRFLLCRVLWTCYSCRPCLFTVLTGNFQHSPAEHPASQPLLQALSTQSFLRGSTKPTFSVKLVYLKFTQVPAPPPFSGSLNVPCPFCYVFFSVPCFLFSFLFFSWGWGSDCPGGYADLSQGWLWKYHMPLICSPVGLHPSSRLGVSIWQHGTPPGFSAYHGLGKLCVGWGFGGVRVLPLLGDFFLPGVSPASQQDFCFTELKLSASSL
jgi:hypothetical protein